MPNSEIVDDLYNHLNAKVDAEDDTFFVTRKMPFYKIVVFCSEQGGNSSYNSRDCTFGDHFNDVARYHPEQPSSQKSEEQQ